MVLKFCTAKGQIKFTGRHQCLSIKALSHQVVMAYDNYYQIKTQMDK